MPDPPRWIPTIERPTPELHPGRGDGEPIREGLIAQPVAAWSSASYLLAGWWLWSRRHRSANPSVAALYAAAVAGNGLGGVAFHGPGDRASKWLHDAALCATLGVMASVEPGRIDRAHLVPALGLVASSSAIVAAYPGWTNPLSGGLAAGATMRLGQALQRGHRPTRSTSLVGLAAMGLALIANRSSVPTSRLHQPLLRDTGHGWWHGLTAIALAAWGSVVFDRDEQQP